MYLEKNKRFSELDNEWLALILTAKRLGLTPTEIRDFFSKDKQEHALDPFKHAPQK
ncbi:DNA-binding anti-repressor SinI [Cytobacillus dafuensis]|uniref:DNA-binding anti-repressor SinI n=2 Tax=Cytobacillus dafuensis TaxID=1742359 RepID=A0A5B8ZB54_CYTDA|nr:DNA-binding anti-repressor SinI [Cytobacillus dafuensis]